MFQIFVLFALVSIKKSNIYSQPQILHAEYFFAFSFCSLIIISFLMQCSIRLAHASKYINHRLRHSIKNIFLIICSG